MKGILFTKKQDAKSNLTDNEVIGIFEDSEDLDVIRKVVEQAQDRLYVSWASVEMKDNAGELIPIDDLVKQQETLLNRNGPITDEHSNRVIGQTLAYKLMEHPETKSKGLLHLNRIFDDNELDDQVWKEITSNERKGSSVSGFNKEVSRGKDPVTGEDVNVLEGFTHMETASVFDGCNPMALNEAFSVVAKSNRKAYKNFAGFDTLAECVEANTGVEDDPVGYCMLMGKKDKADVKKPFAGFDNFNACVAQNQDKDNPQAYCAAIMTAVEKIKETDINKNSNKKNMTKKGDTKMSEEVLKAISSLSEEFKTLRTDVADIKKQLEEEEEMEEEVEPVEAKKEEDAETMEDEDKKKNVHADDEEEEVEKEGAASDIDGLTDAPQEESPIPEDSNDADVFKRIETMMDKKLKKWVSKAQTPRAMGNTGTVSDVKKAEAYSKLPMELATNNSGKSLKTWKEVHKSFDDHMKNINGEVF